MKYRSRNAIVAMLAAGLLVLGGMSGVAAHGPGGDPGKGGGFPGTSAKPLPTGWVWPSGLKTPAVKSHQPQPSHKVEPSKAPKVTPKPFTCTTTPTPTPTAVPTATANVVGDNGAKGANAGKAKMPGSWEKQIKDFLDRAKKVNDANQKAFCNVIPLRKTLDSQLTRRINSLQSWVKQIGKSGLGASDLATVDGELNGLIADTKAFKVQVDGETTLAALQADSQTLAGKAAMYRTVQTWIQEIVGAEKLIVSGPKLVDLENKIAADIAAAPAGSDTADAQIFLNNMKLAVTAGEALVAPLPATLLAITPAQLADGSAKATLTSLRATLFLATWDLSLARMAGAWAERELKIDSHTPKATATPSATATPTATPTATASPI